MIPGSFNSICAILTLGLFPSPSSCLALSSLTVYFSFLLRCAYLCIHEACFLSTCLLLLHTWCCSHNFKFNIISSLRRPHMGNLLEMVRMLGIWWLDLEILVMSIMNVAGYRFQSIPVCHENFINVLSLWFLCRVFLWILCVWFLDFVPGLYSYNSLCWCLYSYSFNLK